MTTAQNLPPTYRLIFLGLPIMFFSLFGLYFYASYSYDFRGFMEHGVFKEVQKEKNVDCIYLFNNSQSAIMQAKLYQKKQLPFLPLSPWFYLAHTKNCSAFKRERGYLEEPVSLEEEKFPLAYSILVYKSLEQVERLLRSIYRPQNYYCIHIDKKAEKPFYKALKSISSCFPNVFICPVSIDVRWGRFSVLEAELVCMQHLLRYPKWKYFINLTGQMFPLNTNFELVRFLRSRNGTNVIVGDTKSVVKYRYKYIFTDEGPTEKLNTPPPHNITIHKGPVHIAAVRQFVEFIFKNKKAQDFLKWCKTTRIPDETFFATLNNDIKLGAPGSRMVLHPPSSKGFTETVFKLWKSGSRGLGLKCYGKYVRDICIPGIRNLRMLKKRKEFFFNKLYIDYNPKVFECLEELNEERVQGELLHIDHHT